MSAAAPAIDARRVIEDLRELDRRTGGPEGARRLCWGPEWRAARDFLRELLAELDLDARVDEAGNLWAPLEGEDEPALAVGSHLDSVPGGGWLDGALGVMAAVGVLRAWRQDSSPPPRSLTLVDWADEEGTRFGRSLYGSSAFAGTLQPDEIAGLADAKGRRPAEVLAENGVDLNGVAGATAGQERIAALLELHIEQGPVLEAQGLGAAAVTGTFGVERLRGLFRGQASHAGSTPMDARRDAALAAADAALRVERIPERHGGVATTGALALRPGIPTAVAGEAELVIDLRNPETEPLGSMLEEARRAAEESAASRNCEVGFEPIWAIEPIGFDPELVAAARAACSEVTGADLTLASGALHDAAEVARVLPAAMVFCPSRAGISHAKEEDTAESDLATGIEAFGLLVNRALRL